MASYAENRKARFKFEVKDTIEAGIELLGTEVKSVRAGKIIIAGSHASECTEVPPDPWSRPAHPSK